MESMPFRSRLVQLMQRSRKALRLYSSVERGSVDHSGELGEVQIAEWRRVNAELLKELGLALDQPSQKRLVSEVFSIRDQFYGEWKVAEADLHRKQRQLLDCSENSDFIKASLLSRELVMLKARAQACQAAHHEVHQVLQKARVSQPAQAESSQEALIAEPASIQAASIQSAPMQTPMQASMRPVVEARDEIKVAKIIPLRRGIS